MGDDAEARARRKDAEERDLLKIRRVERELERDERRMEDDDEKLERDIEAAEHTIDRDLEQEHFGHPPEHRPFWDRPEPPRADDEGAHRANE